MPKKGTPRTATAAAEILRQHEQPEPQQVEVIVTEGTYGGGTFVVQGPVNDGTPTAYKPATRGAKTGLKQGETRVTCILREDQSQVLHDWARTTGRTFREITLAMAERYIEEVIREAASVGLNVRQGAKEPPEAYADLYGDAPDQWAKFFTE